MNNGFRILFFLLVHLGSQVQAQSGNPFPDVKFKEMMFDFGDIEQGQIVEHIFEFINNGEEPFQIDSARSTCGCTVANFDNAPVLKGASGKVPVSFNSKDKMGIQDKSIILFSKGQIIRLRIRMNVLPKKEK